MINRVSLLSLFLFLFWGVGLPFKVHAATQGASRTITAQNFGAGVIFGEPTGLTGKYWLDRENAVDMGLAYSFGDYFILYSDYLKHFKNPIQQDELFFKQLDAYLGVGGVLRFDTRSKNSNDDRDSASIGLRIPFGLEWRPLRPPIGVHLELTPGIRLIPSIEGFVQGGLGIRYYF